jgi:hypothetical protein
LNESGFNYIIAGNLKQLFWGNWAPKGITSLFCKLKGGDGTTDQQWLFMPKPFHELLGANAPQ